MTGARRTSSRRSFLSINLLSMLVALAFVTLPFIIFPVDAQQCGKVFKFVPLIYRGDSASRNDWPFLAALYIVNQNQNATNFICGGTVISTKHILTAAHCIQGKGSSNKLSPDDILVRIGAYNLAEEKEPGAVRMNIIDIYVHPEWDVYTSRYDADIAILVLRESVTFSDYIQPVCMPPDDVIVDGGTTHDVEGHIVGWGLSDNQSGEQIPRHAVVKAINDSYCYREDSYAAVISSPRTFCSGEGNGAPNRGDSGGGLFVLQNRSWVQNGVISVLRTNGTGHVTLDSLSIYTNVKLFKDWILETVAFQENRIHFNCSYSMNDRNEYACWLSDLNIRGKYVEVASLSGNHLHGRTIYNVEALSFESGSLFYLPYKIGDFFINLKRLEISWYLKTKLIRRSVLKNLENLMYLTIDNNDIEFLERDCLWDLPLLTEFESSRNKLTSIDEKLFERNVNLEKVSLYENLLQSLPTNLFYNNAKLKIVSLRQNRLKILPANLFQANPLLERIDLNDNSLKILNENTFTANVNLKILHLNSNHLEILPANVFQTNALLEEISLDDNSLKLIDANTFMRNVNLELIYLSSNQLETLPANLFQKNSLLEEIVLNNNFLKSIPENIFGSNTKLKSVYLNSNELEILPANLFEANTLLETISLYNNPLKIIATNFSGLNNIKNILLVDTSCTTFSFYRSDKLSLLEFQASIRANCSSAPVANG